nr:NAD(P)H-hydrate epimerase [uncultured Bifidobacterium sp.]
MDDAERRGILLTEAWAAEDVRAMERPLLRRGVPLMRMAASALARLVGERLDDRGVAVDEAAVVVLAGAGNNGGDGLYAAAELARRGADVTAIAVGRGLHEGAFAAFVRAGGSVLVLDPLSEIPGCVSGFGAGEAGERLRGARRLLDRASVVIDAMTGIGASGVLRGLPATLASMLGDSGNAGGDSDVPGRPFVVAVDAPSGVGVDDGEVPGACVDADATVTFGVMKPFLMLPPACMHCGEGFLVDLGYDVSLMPSTVRVADSSLAASALRSPRMSDAKYARGVVGLITGSERYPGAGVLTALSAAESGCGMVRHMGPRRVEDAVLARVPEVVSGKGRVESWVVGSGVVSAPGGDDPTPVDTQRAAIAALLAHYRLTGDDEADSRVRCMPPVVVDAGALDLLPDRVDGRVVLTPHAGEMDSLLRRLGERDVDVAARPWRSALRAHELTGATILLKGAMTLVVWADPDSGGPRTVVCGSGPGWLATAGSGDVLAGLLGSLLAQTGGTDPAIVGRSAAAAAYIHGLAGRRASGSALRGWHGPRLVSPTGVLGRNPGDGSDLGVTGHPILASDIAHALPLVIGGLMS